MNTSYTFINATAARLFADLWAKHQDMACDTVARDVSIAVDPESDIGRRFQVAAAWFNAAARSAREIGEEDE